MCNKLLALADEKLFQIELGGRDMGSIKIMTVQRVMTFDVRYEGTSREGIVSTAEPDLGRCVDLYWPSGTRYFGEQLPEPLERIQQDILGQRLVLREVLQRLANATCDSIVLCCIMQRIDYRPSQSDPLKVISVPIAYYETLDGLD